MLEKLTSRLQHASWTAGDLEAAVRDFAEAEGLGLGKVAQPLRVALTGRTVSPGVFDMMEILGREESLARLARLCENGPDRDLRRRAAAAAREADRGAAPAGRRRNRG